MSGALARKWWMTGIVVGLLIVGGTVVAAEDKPSAGGNEKPPANAERLAWWRDARFGMFIHWGPVSLKGTEIGWSRGAEVPIEEYDNLYKQFNPEKFNADAVGRAGQASRHEVHRVHHEAPRRLLHVRHEADRLQHHALALRPRRGQGTGRGVPPSRASPSARTIPSATGIIPISRTAAPAASRSSRTPTWTATSSISAGRCAN